MFCVPTKKKEVQLPTESTFYQGCIGILYIYICVCAYSVCLGEITSSNHFVNYPIV